MSDMEMLTKKFRPATWKEVVGQAAVVRSLKKVLEDKSNRTVLLAGPSGVGKTTLARIAAREIGCTEESDITEVNAANFTGIDDMREIIKSLSYKTLHGRPRVIILDECHRLSPAAWAVLLKPLEEPPADRWWFLCTTDPVKVPQTIQTRCARYTLATVSISDMLELLDDIVAQEKLQFGASDDDQAAIVELCAKKAEGSPRMALVNLATCLAVKSLDEARRLLKEAEGVPGAIDLARILVNGAGWDEIVDLVNGMLNENPESIRRIVQSYHTKVLLDPKTKKAERHLAVLDAFNTPFDHMAQVLLACGLLIFGH